MLDIFLVLTALAYNLAIIVLMAFCFANMNLKSMLQEKRTPPAGPAPAAAGAAPGATSGSAPADGDGNSYSRITGCAGAVVLTSFIWALGNAVIFKAYDAPDTVGPMLANVAPFILASSALFAPYAFNQLSTMFAPKP